MNLTDWAVRNKITTQAMKELTDILTYMPECKHTAGSISEASIQTDIRLEASKMGARLWRNNVGAGELKDGSFLRWGLCNDSKAMNEHIKSADLIGIRPVLITQEMVGKTIGQFISREVKKESWKYKGTEREKAQLRWIEMIRVYGGDAAFANGIGSIR